MSNVLLPMDTRLKTCYQTAKNRTLEELILISGYHRKSAIRLLNGAVTIGNQRRRSAAVHSVYGVAVQQALLVIWEASDRLCNKRLEVLLPQLIPAMEKHKHLSTPRAVSESQCIVHRSPVERNTYHYG